MDFKRLLDPQWWYSWYCHFGVIGNVAAGALVLILSKWLAEAWAALCRVLLNGLWKLVLKPLWTLLCFVVRRVVRWLYARLEKAGGEECETCALPV